jgi:hypothetical protein
MVRNALLEMIWIDVVVAEGEVLPDTKTLLVKSENFNTTFDLSKRTGPQRTGPFPITLGDLAATYIRGSTFHPALEDRARTAARLALSNLLMGD